ncbi:hypothetical protein ACHMW4_04295 [Mesorhizobium sp. UC22_110]|uniref:hypothetical protein n=1 Tax=unclassified Mesorhizobium TaxID=325217 RepID=UPI003670FA15
MVRLLIIVLYLPIMIYAIAARLVTGTRSALWFAWNDCRIEHDAMRRSWRLNRLKTEDFE